MAQATAADEAESSTKEVIGSAVKGFVSKLRGYKQLPETLSQVTIEHIETHTSKQTK